MALSLVSRSMAGVILKVTRARLCDTYVPM
jgi:hypothetical protein